MELGTHCLATQTAAPQSPYAYARTRVFSRHTLRSLLKTHTRTRTHARNRSSGRHAARITTLLSLPIYYIARGPARSLPFQSRIAFPAPTSSCGSCERRRVGNEPRPTAATIAASEAQFIYKTFPLPRTRVAASEKPLPVSQPAVASFHELSSRHLSPVAVATTYMRKTDISLSGTKSLSALSTNAVADPVRARREV